MDIEPLAQIIDCARTKNGVSTKVSRAALSAEVAQLSEDIFGCEVTTEQHQPTPWDLVAEEFPVPDRRYKVFSVALAAGDPLVVLREQPAERSPSELFLLQKRIDNYARTRLPRIERGLPDLKTADWAKLSDEQQAVVRKHIENLRLFYYRTQKRTRNPLEDPIDLAVHGLAEIFAKHSCFEGSPTDLPYSSTSPFIKFVAKALAADIASTKLRRDTLSKRWRRLKGHSDKPSK